MVEHQDHPGGVAHVTHNVRRRTTRGSIHWGKHFVYANDVEGLSIKVIGFSNLLLEITDKVVIVNTAGEQLALFSAQANLPLIPTFGAIVNPGNGQRVIKTQHSMFLPFPLMPYVLTQEPSLPAREAITTLTTAMRSITSKLSANPWLISLSTRLPKD